MNRGSIEQRNRAEQSRIIGKEECEKDERGVFEHPLFVHICICTSRAESRTIRANTQVFFSVSATNPCCQAL
jgi:hypothetical protein